jgi:hypothetical protein
MFSGCRSASRGTVLYFFRQEVKEGPKTKTPQLEPGRTFLQGLLYHILKFSQGKFSPIM